MTPAQTGVVEALNEALSEQMEAQDAGLPSSMARQQGLVWLEGWFDLHAALASAKSPGEPPRHRTSEPSDPAIPATQSPDADEDRERVEAQDQRRRTLVERLGTIADLACGKPLQGDLGDVAYDLLRQAAAQIASDRLRIAALTPAPTPEPSDAGMREALFHTLHVLERLRDLSPFRANAATASDLHGSVQAIASAAVDRLTSALTLPTTSKGDGV